LPNGKKMSHISVFIRYMHTKRPAPPRAHQVRALHQPRAVRVWTDRDGHPCRIQPSKRPPSAVVHIRERWRIDDEWWRKPIARVYYDLVLDSGRSLVLYFDELNSSWFIHE